MEGGEIKILMNVSLTTLGSLLYSYYISAKIPKGTFRFISLLPIFCIFTILPSFHSSGFFTCTTAFFITWLANFRLLLFAFNQGPLSLDLSQSSLPKFIAIASLPIKIKQNKNQSKTRLPLNLATESLALSVLITLVYDYKDRVHPKLILVSYCCLCFLLIDILITLSGFIVRALFGLELERPSNEPYLSTSLQDFWGRRWNITVTNTLRETIYKPVRSASAVVVGPNWAPVPGVLAAFLVSGLMHELLFYYVTPSPPSWEMTMFFVLHGVCVVLEIVVKKVALSNQWRLPWFVSGPLTIGFVVATSFWLFFPPLVRNGTDTKVIQELVTSSEYFASKLAKLISFQLQPQK